MNTRTRTARRIRTVPLVFGVIFVAAGYAGIVAASDVDDVGVWLWPAALVAVGLGGLVATVRSAVVARRDRRSDDTATDGPDGDPSAIAGDGDTGGVDGEAAGVAGEGPVTDR